MDRHVGRLSCPRGWAPPQTCAFISFSYGPIVCDRGHAKKACMLRLFKPARLGAPSVNAVSLNAGGPCKLGSPAGSRAAFARAKAWTFMLWSPSWTRASSLSQRGRPCVVKSRWACNGRSLMQTCLWRRAASTQCSKSVGGRVPTQVLFGCGRKQSSSRAWRVLLA